MTEPILKDPRELYHTGKFADQDQHTPALQDKMLPEPDCGEESYVGNHLLENRRVIDYRWGFRNRKSGCYSLCQIRRRCRDSIFPW